MAQPLDFYYRNRDYFWTIQPIPDNILDDVSRLKWIMKQPIGWIQLDLDIDLKIWRKESQEAERYYVKHREGGDHFGWKSCCIHGLGVDKTGVWNIYADTEPEYQWTELSKLTPRITEFWKHFPFETLKRVRFMKVEAGGWVEPHNDTPPGVDVSQLDLLNHIIPVNIAIIHPSNCHMVLEGLGSVPWQEGRAFTINITNTHSVVNLSERSRVHMIGHGLIGNKIEEFAELMVRSYRKQYELSIL